MTDAAFVSMNQVGFSYGEHRLFDQLDLTLDKGTFTCVAGPNGSGKTTLLRLLSGSLSPHAGEIRIEGTLLAGMPVRERALSMAVVPQQSQVVFPYTVWEMAAMGRNPHLGRWGYEKEEDNHAIRRALESTGLKGFEKRVFQELSGGEQQRTLLARALAQQAPFLLLDEPTSALDVKHAQEFISVLQDMRPTLDLTILMVTHDINQAARIADRVVLLKSGRIEADGAPGDTLTVPVLQKVFDAEFETATTKSGLKLFAPGS